MDAEPNYLTKYIEKLCELENNELSKWETEFVDSVSKKQVAYLTRKQIIKINDLYERHCK